MRFYFLGLAFLFTSACASSFLKYEKAEQLKSNEEFDQQVRILPTVEENSEGKKTPPAENPHLAVSAKDNSSVPPAMEGKLKKSKKKAKTSAKSAKSTAETSSPENTMTSIEPPLEDTEGMNGRRPIKDPFRVGEEIIHDVHYFKVSAGTLTLRTDPFVQVNGRKSYSFVTEVRSSRMFSTFYSVEDQAVTLMDYDLLIPRVFTLHVKESGQLREARSFFDFEKMTATYWEKKVTEKNGEEEKKQHWEILPFSQNVFSAIFYMRVFKWDVGKEYAFRVADDNENLVFKGKALRKEKIQTEVGEFSAIVVKPEIMMKGAFKPVGDIHIWLSDDDRKIVLRIESSIRIGTLVSEIVKYKPGQP